jgi:glutamine synthetase
VPVTKRGKSESTRVEYRAIDPSCNPYLAFSLLLAAGMKGIEDNYELPPEAKRNMFELSSHDQIEMGVDRLPQSLAEAIDLMEHSSLVREVLGDHIYEWFLRNKRSEWREYQRVVTQFELDRYLPVW